MEAEKKEGRETEPRNNDKSTRARARTAIVEGERRMRRQNN